MRNKKLYRGVPGVLGLTALIVTGCPGPESPGTITCGPNTEEVDGKCVSTVGEAPCAEGASRNPDSGQCEPDVECGPGTTYNATSQECEPDSVCGEGTTFNEATGQCDPDVVCGDGTTFDPSTGACLPDVVCGDGTHLDTASGECLPDENCGAGTTFDPATASCVPNLICGPGLTDVEGVCLSALDLIVAESDLTESAAETNDPLFGGAPEGVTLEAAGERVVLVGTIGRPVDFDADAVIDQDRDVWRFTGSAGQMLRIRVISTGAFQPAFTLTGPNDYYREPQLGFTVNADREVVLPYDGEYDLTVLPSLVLQGASEPIGADDADYAAIIEQLEWPTPVAVAVAEDGTLAEAPPGNLLGLSDNFYNISTAADAPVILESTATTGNTTPALLLFRADGTFLAEIPFDEDGGIETAVTSSYVSVSDGLVVVLDWQTSNGIDVPFTLSASQLGTVDFGTVAIDELVQLPALSVLGLGGISFSFDATAGQVVMTDFYGISANVTLLSPSGQTVYSGEDPFFESIFYAQETGTYRWIVVNTATSDETPSVAIRSSTPHVAGPWDGTTEQSASFAGDVIEVGQRPNAEWFLVEVTGPAIVQYDFTYALGEPDVDVYALTPQGFATERRFQGEDDPGTLRSYRTTPGFVLARFDAGIPGSTPNPWVHEWTMDASVLPVPTLTEVEPNDTMDATQPIAEVAGQALRLLANVDNDEFDLYTLTLAGPLAANEVLQVEIESLSDDNANYLRFRLPGTSLDDDELYQAHSAPLSRWMLFPSDGPGPFVLEVEGTGLSGSVQYLLQVKRVTLPAMDVEPNDTPAAAQDLGSFATADLPVQVIGRTLETEPDVYQLAFSEGLPAGTALRVSVENMTEVANLYVRVLDAAENVLADVWHEDPTVFIPMAAPGTLFIEVEGDSTTTQDLYRVVVDTWDDVLDVEPNDSSVEASPLPAVAVGGTVSAWGSAFDTDTDTFQINFDGDPTADEVIAVRWYNKTGRGDNIVSVLNAADQMIAGSELYAGEVYFSPGADPGPFFIEFVADRSTADDYPENYLIEVERLGNVGLVETEPNDDTAAANALTLPAQVFGLFYDDDADYYAVTLGSDLTNGEKLIVDGLVPYALDFINLRVFDGTGAEIALASDLAPHLEVTLPTTTAGTTYYVSVESTDSLLTNERHPYELSVAVAVP